jgi:hypothetical protein
MVLHHTSWSASGILHTANVNDVVTLQADFEESGPYTLQFSVDAENVPTDVNPIAYIDWKVEGNWVHREITLISGTSISGTAEAVRVLIRDHQEAGAGDEYRVSVQLAKGTRPNIQQPAMYARQSGELIPAAALGAAGVLDVPVPQGIGVVSIYASVSHIVGAGPVLIPAQTVIGLGLGSFGYTMQFDPTQPFWYPLPVTTGIVRFVNSNAFAVDVTITYGIDG